MSINYGFKVCRVCLTPEPAVKLRSMFEGRGEMADWFQIVSGCSLSFDRGKHEALICPKCSIDVKAAFDLHENIRRVDIYYFQARREEASGYNENFERDQTPVKKSQAETVSLRDVNNASSGSASASGGGASRKQSAVQGGVSRLKSFASAPKPNPGKLFKCHVCEKFFVTNTVLHKHIKSVHEKINDFACDLCPMKCYWKANLHRHIVRHHMSSESCPQLKCNFESCKKSFRTLGNLVNHRKIHSNVRQFKCSTCQKSFKFNRNLTQHQKKKNSCTSKA